MFFRCLALAAAVGVVSFPARAPAEVIYDTFQFGEDPVDAAPIGVSPPFVLQIAYPFDVTVDHRLESITLSLWTDPDGTSENADFLLRLREDDAGLPGNVLEEWTLLNTFGPGQTVVHEFVSVDTPLLLDGQRYWVNLGALDDMGFAAWNGSLANTTDFVSAREGGLNPPWLSFTTPYMLALVTIEAPEPGQTLLLAAGAAVLAAGALRRRS